MCFIIVHVIYNIFIYCILIICLLRGQGKAQARSVQVTSEPSAIIPVEPKHHHIQDLGHFCFTFLLDITLAGGSSAQTAAEAESAPQRASSHLSLGLCLRCARGMERGAEPVVV